MIYRILTAPPGYAPHEKYLVGEYANLDFDSSSRYMTNLDGSKFFATIEDAHKTIPSDARQLKFTPNKHEFFIELWELS